MEAHRFTTLKIATDLRQRIKVIITPWLSIKTVIMSFSSKISNSRLRQRITFMLICIKMAENKFQQAWTDFLNSKSIIIQAKLVMKVHFSTSTTRYHKKNSANQKQNKYKRLMIKLYRRIGYRHKVFRIYLLESQSLLRSKIIWHQDNNNSHSSMVKVRLLLNSCTNRFSGTTVAIRIANSSLRDMMLIDFPSRSEVCLWNSTLTPQLVCVQVKMKI